MFLQFVWFFVGLVLLVVGAESLVRGASRSRSRPASRRWWWGSPSSRSAPARRRWRSRSSRRRRGQVDIAIGNVVGSNIFNVLFILGVSALIAPLVVNAQLIRQEVPVMIGASLLLWALAADGGIRGLDGALLFGLIVAYTAFLVVQSRRETKATTRRSTPTSSAQGTARDKHWGHARCCWCSRGLALLVLGSQPAGRAPRSTIARAARRVGAGRRPDHRRRRHLAARGRDVGRSATMRGERDIAVGNVVGSNTFNILGVLGVSALVAPGAAAGRAVGARVRPAGDDRGGGRLPAGVLHRARRSRAGRASCSSATTSPTPPT